MEIHPIDAKKLTVTRICPHCEGELFYLDQPGVMPDGTAILICEDCGRRYNKGVEVALRILSYRGREVSVMQNYTALAEHEKATLLRQLTTVGSPQRLAAIALLRERYAEYREAGGELVALAWAGEVLVADVWNALFSASCRRGSYGCPTVLLVNRDGRYRAAYKR